MTYLIRAGIAILGIILISIVIMVAHHITTIALFDAVTIDILLREARFLDLTRMTAIIVLPYL